MTIPTWGGIQDLTAIYCIINGNLYRYKNWKNGKPTHSIDKTGAIDQSFQTLLERKFKKNLDRFIIFSKNEDTNRALWEIGYMVLNVLLKATGDNINFEALLLPMSQKKDYIEGTGISGMIAIVAL
jgi:hypothetical protein